MSAAKTKAKKPPLVHFTHHVCLAADPRTTKFRHVSPYSSSEDNAYVTMFGSNARGPANRGACHSGHNRVAFAIDPAGITCRACLRDQAHESDEDAWYRQRMAAGYSDGREHSAEEVRDRYAWCSDPELRARTWYLCCRHLGHEAPDGYGGDQLVKFFGSGQLSSKLRRRWPIGITAVRAESVLKSLAEVMTSFPPEVLKLVQPAIDDARLSAEFLAEAERLLERAWDVVKAASKTIFDERIVDSGIREHVEAEPIGATLEAA